ncbi:MAG: CheR family methyltransferase, partial [Dehalococcoidia bacterium]|nr:CheR family methyltransferase [Dehalococcoidia bacterium]
DGMPRNAVDTGLVDYVAPIEELPKRIIAYVGSSLQLDGTGEEHEARHASALQELLRLLKARTKHDFSQYKKSTLYRRIAKRTSLLQIAGLTAYTGYVTEHPEELDAIFQEFLIGVTRFFRDPEAFEYLENNALPELVNNAAPDSAIRVWVTGCSTGEEAYSISIAFHECISKLRSNAHLKIQIFATDIDGRAIAIARKGTYPANIAADVSKERLDRFFAEDGGGYRIKRVIRETVVFAPHDVIADPPFTKMDLISCRNMLIYFSPELQKKVLPTFYYALNPGGILFLGTAESVSGAPELFVGLDTKCRVFRRKEVKIPPLRAMSISAQKPGPGAHRQGDTVKQPEPGISEDVRQALLEKYAPPSVVVDADGDIVYVSGRTGMYLEPAEGSGHWNICSMAREGLKRELTRAVYRASTLKTGTVLKGLKVRINGGYGLTDVSVSPFTSPDTLSGLIMVTFFDVTPAEPSAIADNEGEPAGAADPTLAGTEDELKLIRDQLKSLAEEMEAAQEELKSANEELQSTNEELQSANEELISSKEELESLNEELVTLNTELQTKVNELTGLNNDMANLLNSTEIATLFLDAKLRIKRFTPAAVGMFNLRTIDIGRPITDITQNLDYKTIEQDVNAVLDSLAMQERQVLSKDGRWYIMRIMPYRTLDNVIDGVVITFSNVTQMKQLEDALRESETLSRALADIGADISKSLDLEYVTGLAIAESSEALGLEAGSLAVREDGEWVIRESRGLTNLPPGTRLTDEDMPYLGLVERESSLVVIDDASSDDLATRGMVDTYGIRSVLGVPLIAGGDFVGVLSLISTSGPRSYGDASILFVRKLATAVSLALSNIRLYESEHKAKKDAEDAMRMLADQHTQLQQALLPAQLPSIPGYRLAAEFIPGSAGKLVGGDFYDIFDTENGGLAVVIGDVAGKGVDAAALAVATRSTIRAFTYELNDACKALAHTAEVIYSLNGEDSRFVTVGLV